MSAFIERRVGHVIRATVLAASLFACSNADRGFAAPTQRPAPSDALRSVASPEGLASPDWQTTLTALIAQNNVNPLVASRAYALLGVAEYRAVERAKRGNGDVDNKVASVDEESEQGGRDHRASDRGAVAGASAVVLSYVFPLQRQTFEDMVTAQRDASPGQSQRAFARGEAIGRTEGAKIVERAQGDRFNTSFTGTIPTGPGVWISNTTPATIGGGQMPAVLPWFLTSASQFRSAPPPAF